MVPKCLIQIGAEVSGQFSTGAEVGSVMEVHHPVFYVSLGHMQNSMRSSVTLKLKLTLTLTLTDTGGAVLTLMLGYRPGGELP